MSNTLIYKTYVIYNPFLNDLKPVQITVMSYFDPMKLKFTVPSGTVIANGDAISILKFGYIQNVNTKLPKEIEQSIVNMFKQLYKEVAKKEVNVLVGKITRKDCEFVYVEINNSGNVNIHGNVVTDLVEFLDSFLIIKINDLKKIRQFIKKISIKHLRGNVEV